MIIAIMAATLMQVLDATIANVALPHMQAALGATPDSVVWVLTSYIIMAAIATPITGWLETRFGRRNLFAVSVAGFTISSALCGASTSLEMMVAARALQGIFGASIGPLGQATLLDSTPREKHPQVMLIWGMGIMIGPILGPVLGGWLTDSYGWRWVFFINLPIGLAATAGIWLTIDKRHLARRSIDLVGFALLAIALASLQLLLDRGSQRDWFESTEILIEAGLAVATLWMFVVHIVTTPNPLLSLALFRDPNFVIAVMFTMLITGVTMAGSALTAPMLQVLMGYDAKGAGLLMMPRGVGVFIAMPIATVLSRRLDPRFMIAMGLATMAVALWTMTGFNLEMGSGLIIYSGLFQGLGMGFAFLPLNVLAFSTLPPHLRTEGASVYNLARSVGGSITISLMGALLSRNAQVSHADMSGHITPTSAPFIESGLIEQLGIQGGMVIRMIDAEINRQALMIAYINDFWVMEWCAILLLPLVVFMRRGRRTSDTPTVHIE